MLIFVDGSASAKAPARAVRGSAGAPVQPWLRFAPPRLHFPLPSLLQRVQLRALEKKMRTRANSNVTLQCRSRNFGNKLHFRRLLEVYTTHPYIFKWYAINL